MINEFEPVLARPVVRTRSTRWNEEVLQAVVALKSSVCYGREVFVEIGACGLAAVKSGTKYGVTDGKHMILAMEYESVKILANGWIVACKYGCYILYNSKGEMYKGLLFLKKENAIKFAKTLI